MEWSTNVIKVFPGGIYIISHYHNFLCTFFGYM